MEQQIPLQYLQETYEKLTELGSPAKSSTWLVRSRDHGGLYVWKEITDGSLEVYERLKTINSPQLPPIRQVVRTPQGGVVLRDYISGRTLDALLEEQGHLPQETALSFTRQLLSAAELLEKNDLVHRDIQPKNILISTDGVVKLIDFGIARMLKEQAAKDTEQLGTVGYAAPEQFGFRQTDSRADLYAIGMVFHKMLTGHLPQGMNCENKDYRSFILHCIEMDPQKRFRTVQEAILSFDATKGKCLRPYAPPGFRSRTLWKEIAASFYYSFVVILTLVSMISSGGRWYVGLLQGIGTAFQFGLSLWALTNGFDYYHRLFPFRKMKESARLAVQIAMAIVLVGVGCLIQTAGWELNG